MSGNFCEMCGSTKRLFSNLSFFKFPAKDRSRCQQWIEACGNVDFLDLSIKNLEQKIICAAHFSERSFTNSKRNRLVHDAVPRSHLEDVAQFLLPKEDNTQQSHSVEDSEELLLPEDDNKAQSPSLEDVKECVPSLEDNKELLLHSTLDVKEFLPQFENGEIFLDRCKKKKSLKKKRQAKTTPRERKLLKLVKYYRKKIEAKDRIINNLRKRSVTHKQKI